MQYQELETILSTTNRLAFSTSDMKILLEYLKLSRNKGYDISLDPSLNNGTDSFEQAISQGYLILRSTRLDTCFLFLNVNAGRGLFGGQKRKVMSFIGPSEEFVFTPGHVFNKLIIGLTGINNVYRG
ncbi:MAG: hypothetical protein ACTJGG_07055 [Marinomonas foliarum]